jgi:hypothetical protein
MFRTLTSGKCDRIMALGRLRAVARRLAGGPVKSFFDTHVAAGFGELFISAVGVALFFVAPLAMSVVVAFRGKNGGFTLEHFAKAFDFYSTDLLFTLAIVVLSTVLIGIAFALRSAKAERYAGREQLDDQGREMISYLPGETAGGRYPWPVWTFRDWEVRARAPMWKTTLLLRDLRETRYQQRHLVFEF